MDRLTMDHAVYRRQAATVSVNAWFLFARDAFSRHDSQMSRVSRVSGETYLCVSALIANRVFADSKCDGGRWPKTTSVHG